MLQRDYSSEKPQFPTPDEFPESSEKDDTIW